jgi:hypothetical protein
MSIETYLKAPIQNRLFAFYKNKRETPFYPIDNFFLNIDLMNASLWRKESVLFSAFGLNPWALWESPKISVLKIDRYRKSKIII